VAFWEDHPESSGKNEVEGDLGRDTAQEALALAYVSNGEGLIRTEETLASTLGRQDQQDLLVI
jgi:hypothetical protein